MQLACQCICAWSQTWNPTSADRFLLPPLSSWEQLLILLPEGLVSRLLVGSVFPSALLWPALPAAAGSGSAPGCEQTGAAQAAAGGRQWNEGRRSSVQKAFSFASRQGQRTRQRCWKHNTPHRGQESQPPSPTQEKKGGVGMHLRPVHPTWEHVYYSLGCMCSKWAVVTLLSIPTELAFCYWSVSLPVVPASENPTNHHYLLTAKWWFSLVA